MRFDSPTKADMTLYPLSLHTFSSSETSQCSLRHIILKGYSSSKVWNSNTLLLRHWMFWCSNARLKSSDFVGSILIWLFKSTLIFVDARLSFLVRSHCFVLFWIDVFRCTYLEFEAGVSDSNWPEIPHVNFVFKLKFYSCFETLSILSETVIFSGNFFDSYFIVWETSFLFNIFLDIILSYNISHPWNKSQTFLSSLSGFPEKPSVLFVPLVS